MRPENLLIETGIPGDEQQANFGNATLQGTGEGLEFSIAVHVEIPAGLASTNEAVLADYLRAMFMRCSDDLHVEIQIGLDQDRQRELEDAEDEAGRDLEDPDATQGEHDEH